MSSQEIVVYILNIVSSLCAIYIMIHIPYIIRSVSRYLTEKNEITKYSVDINCQTKQSDVDEELDYFIKGRWEEYFICNLGWKKIDNITQKEQEQIMLDMAANINETISPVLLSKLARFYNPNKNSQGISGIDKIIADKIHIIVLNYSVDTNSMK